MFLILGVVMVIIYKMGVVELMLLDTGGGYGDQDHVLPEGLLQAVSQGKVISAVVM